MNYYLVWIRIGSKKDIDDGKLLDECSYVLYRLCKANTAIEAEDKARIYVRAMNRFVGDVVVDVEASEIID